MRRFAVASGQEQGFTGDCDSLALLVSEVATNALLHGRGDVLLSVVLADGRLRVEVTDASNSMPVRRQADSNAQGGRGLALLEQLSDSWGVSTPSAQGKIVWFELVG
jgi:anti-sigma regulatory factor (Ser/Thr protein kinase)